MNTTGTATAPAEFDSNIKDLHIGDIVWCNLGLVTVTTAPKQTSHFDGDTFACESAALHTEHGPVGMVWTLQGNSRRFVDVTRF